MFTIVATVFTTEVVIYPAQIDLVSTFDKTQVHIEGELLSPPVHS